MKLGDTALTSAVRMQLKSLKEFNFQDIVGKILFKQHGAFGFSDLRPVRDKGCDGVVISEQCAIACYGPENRTIAKFKKKVNEDYSKYVLNWQNLYPKFRFFLNRDPSPEEVTFAKSLGSHVEEPWGIERLMEVISNLPWGSQIYIYRCLNVEEELISKDFIRLILNDLINSTVIRSDNLGSKKKAPHIQTKIDINISDDERDAFHQLLELTRDSQIDVGESLFAFDDSEINMVKSRIIREYEDTINEGVFYSRYRRMKQRLNDRYNPGSDDPLAHYIDAILGYMFCQCLIGKEPKRSEGYGALTS